MVHKEFIRVMEANVSILDKLSGRLHNGPTDVLGCTRQQASVLVRLHLNGQAKLKDIARRENISAPNLCAVFRTLERDGFISRAIDDADRRNTYYSITPAGTEIAVRAMEMFRNRIATMFRDISREDETALTASLKTMNKILIKMELANA